MLSRQDGQRRDIQQGLRTLLLTALSPESGFRSYCVLTTSPSAWISQAANDHATIIDVSGNFPGVIRTESDMQDRVLSNARAAGWSNAQISTQTRIELPGSKVAISDITLKDQQGNPIAIIELKSSGRNLLDAREQAVLMARALGIPFAFLSDGTKILPADNPVQVLPGFPTPQDLGVAPTVMSDVGVSPPASKLQVLRCDTPEALAKTIASIAPVNVVVDGTSFPWGSKSAPQSVAAIRPHLPESVRSATHFEPTLVMIELIAGHASVRRLVATVPRGVTFDRRYGITRDFLRSRLGLAAVIELPAAPVFIDAMIPASVLALGDYAMSIAGKTIFLPLASTGDLIEPEGQAWLEAFKQSQLGKEPTAGFLAVVSPGDDWTASTHQPGVAEAVERLGKLAELVPLSDLFDVFQGMGHPRYPESRAGIGVAVIRGREVALGVQDKNDLPWYKIPDSEAEHARIVKGDILLQRIGATPKCMIAASTLEGAVASDTVYVLRPKDDRADPVLVCQFLSSVPGQQLLTANMQRLTIPTQSLTRLRTIQVPVLPQEVARELDGLQHIEADLRARADRYAALRLGLFEANSRADLESQLRQIRTEARAITSSIQQVGTLQFQISNFYPFPLAFPYRTLAGLTDLRECYAEQLRVAENILAFVASLMLAMARPEDLRNAGIGLEPYWQGGISPGHWREICQRTADILRNDEDNGLSPALAKLWGRKSQFADNASSLITALNDFKHHRGPKIDEDFRSARDTAAHQLDHLMADLAFLIEYPICQVRDYDVARGTETLIVRALLYVGDHPGHRQEQRTYPRPLRKNDLYIEVGPDRWRPLFPFITVQSCERCKSNETYFVDKWQGKGGDAQLKSFERGHPEPSSDVGTGLSNW